MEPYEANSLNKFSDVIASIQSKYSGIKLLYRGQDDYEWELESTLSRATNKREYGLLEYIRRVCACSGNIQAFTNSDFDFQKLYAYSKKLKIDQNSLDEIFEDVVAYNIFAHLRQHGFPSPMLDWTESSKIALFFSLLGKSEFGAVFVYVERPNYYKVSGTKLPQIKTLGTYTIKSKRHILQKSNYTIAHRLEPELKDKIQFIDYVHFENEKNPKYDIIIKIKIEKFDRIKILKDLDEVNLNLFSLMQDEDSLMKYLSFREFEIYQHQKK